MDSHARGCRPPATKNGRHCGCGGGGGQWSLGSPLMGPSHCRRVQRISYVARCLSSGGQHPCGSAASLSGSSNEAESNCASEDVGSRHQRLLVGLGGSSGTASASLPPPQFSAGGGAPPQQHDAAHDPVGRAQLLARRDEQLALYAERGYIVCRNFLSAGEVARHQAAIGRIIDDWPERTAPEIRGRLSRRQLCHSADTGRTLPYRPYIPIYTPGLWAQMALIAAALAAALHCSVH